MAQGGGEAEYRETLLDKTAYEALFEGGRKKRENVWMITRVATVRR